MTDPVWTMLAALLVLTLIPAHWWEALGALLRWRRDGE